MLSRPQRLHAAKDFNRVWRTGQVRRGRAITVRISQPTAAWSRYGFVVSSAVAKKATVRNLVKRRLRAIARSLPASPAADIVVYATKASTTASYADLARELPALLNRSYASPPHRRH